jgi:DNA-binding YbaB/EbfC family protein
MQQNMGKMLKGITELQKRVDAAQKEIGEAQFEGSAANNLVKVTITGKGEFKRVVIDPSLLTEDAETIADLVMVAGNKANEATEALAKTKLSGIAGGMLPLGLKIPGLG